MARNQKVTTYRNIDLDETGVVVSSSPCKLAVLIVTNVNATSLRYLKLYDKATAATNADTPVITIPLAPSVLGGQLVINLKDREFAFATGLSARCTTGVADNDTGAPGANEIVVDIGTIANLDYVL